MGTIRQYIGARYVTKIYENSLDPSSAEWESNVTYEPLTMVTYNNSSYLSKKEVPANIGNPASNPLYWVVTGAYNGQIAQLQNDIQSINAVLDTIDDEGMFFERMNTDIKPESFELLLDNVCDFDNGEELQASCTDGTYLYLSVIDRNHVNYPKIKRYKADTLAFYDEYTLSDDMHCNGMFIIDNYLYITAFGGTLTSPHLVSLNENDIYVCNKATGTFVGLIHLTYELGSIATTTSRSPGDAKVSRYIYHYSSSRRTMIAYKVNPADDVMYPAIYQPLSEHLEGDIQGMSMINGFLALVNSKTGYVKNVIQLFTKNLELAYNIYLPKDFESIEPQSILEIPNEAKKFYLITLKGQIYQLNMSHTITYNQDSGQYANYKLMNEYIGVNMPPAYLDGNGAQQPTYTTYQGSTSKLVETIGGLDINASKQAGEIIGVLRCNGSKYPVYSDLGSIVSSGVYQRNVGSDPHLCIFQFVYYYKNSDNVYVPDDTNTKLWDYDIAAGTVTYINGLHNIADNAPFINGHEFTDLYKFQVPHGREIFGSKFIHS